jgi:hypothetical protein
LLLGSGNGNIPADLLYFILTMEKGGLPDNISQETTIPCRRAKKPSLATVILISIQNSTQYREIDQVAVSYMKKESGKEKEMAWGGCEKLPGHSHTNHNSRKKSIFKFQSQRA